MVLSSMGTEAFFEILRSHPDFKEGTLQTLQSVVEGLCLGIQKALLQYVVVWSEGLHICLQPKRGLSDCLFVHGMTHIGTDDRLRPNPRSR